MSKPKREMERHSGTGHSIKEPAKRDGGGGHGWGNDTEEIHDAVVKHVEEEKAAESGANEKKKANLQKQTKQIRKTMVI